MVRIVVGSTPSAARWDSLVLLAVATWNTHDDDGRIIVPIEGDIVVHLETAGEGGGWR